MSGPVKLPRRLPDASPRLDLQEPPADPVERERYWLRRAIRHCERWGMLYAYVSSFMATAKRRRSQATPMVDGYGERADGGWRAEWLPPDFRALDVGAMRLRLAKLEGGAA